MSATSPSHVTAGQIARHAAFFEAAAGPGLDEPRHGVRHTVNRPQRSASAVSDSQKPGGSPRSIPDVEGMPTLPSPEASSGPSSPRSAGVWRAVVTEDELDGEPDAKALPPIAPDAQALPPSPGARQRAQAAAEIAALGQNANRRGDEPTTPRTAPSSRGSTSPMTTPRRAPRPLTLPDVFLVPDTQDGCDDARAGRARTPRSARSRSSRSAGSSSSRRVQWRETSNAGAASPRHVRPVSVATPPAPPPETDSDDEDNSAGASPSSQQQQQQQQQQQRQQQQQQQQQQHQQQPTPMPQLMAHSVSAGSDGFAERGMPKSGNSSMTSVPFSYGIRQDSLPSLVHAGPSSTSIDPLVEGGVSPTQAPAVPAPETWHVYSYTLAGILSLTLAMLGDVSGILALVIGAAGAQPLQWTLLSLAALLVLAVINVSHLPMVYERIAAKETAKMSAWVLQAIGHWSMLVAIASWSLPAFIVLGFAGLRFLASMLWTTFVISDTEYCPYSASRSNTVWRALASSTAYFLLLGLYCLEYLPAIAATA